MRGLPLVAILSAFMVVEPERTTPEEFCPVAITFSYYEVQGNTPAEIERSLQFFGPRDDRGQIRFAYTDWKIRWKWQRTADKKVDLNSLTLHCSAEIKLPRLVVAPSTSLGLIRAWNDFVERTRQHELAHVKHVELGAPKIRARLREAATLEGALSPSRANVLVGRVIAELRGLDTSYDRRTNHGFTEGTWTIESES